MGLTSDPEVKKSRLSNIESKKRDAPENHSGMEKLLRTDKAKELFMPLKAVWLK
jgi:hypothetical protein